MKLAITLVSLLLLAGVAGADNKSKADALFKQGKKLMAEKRYAEACDSFEQSFKLDPVVGAQLNVAKCYEEWGKLGRAFTAYQEAEKLARETKDRRAGQIKDLVENLDAQVPRLTIRLPKDAPRKFNVTMDRQPVTIFGEAFVVDPGPKTLEWSVADGPKKQKIVTIERGAESEVTLDVPKGTVLDKGGTGGGDNGGDGDGDGGDGGGKGEADPRPAPPGRNQRLGGIALAGAGALAIGVSTVMTLSAKGKYNDALDMYCGGMKNNCDPMGLQLTADARSTANTATVIFLVGTAAVGGGVALYLLAPKGPAGAARGGDEQTSRYLVPAVTPTSAGIVFGGRY
jgi:tetratricopeptide (TPR) repeat protein